MGKNGPKIRQPRKLLRTHNILHWRECKEKQLLDKWRLMTCLGKKYSLWHIVEVLPYTISWHYLTIFDYIRQLLSRFDILGHYSTLFNFIRSHLTTFDIIRTHLISFDSFHKSEICENSSLFNIILHFSTLLDIIWHPSTV